MTSVPATFTEAFGIDRTYGRFFNGRHIFFEPLYFSIGNSTDPVYGPDGRARCYRSGIGAGFDLYRATEMRQDGPADWVLYGTSVMDGPRYCERRRIINAAQDCTLRTPRNGHIQAAVRRAIAEITPVDLVHYGRPVQFLNSCDECSEEFLTEDSARDFCDDCGIMCEHCEETVGPDDTESVEWCNDYERNVSAVWCESCARTDGFTCSHCNEQWANSSRYDCECGYACPGCYEDEVHFCDECESSYCGDSCCESSDDATIHGYSYKPRAAFHGTGPLFLGLELEITSSRGNAGLILDEETATFLYLKEDSSINGQGFEIVSHPASLAYWSEAFPWAKLRELYRAGSRAGHNGLHVHISRAAFEDPAHILRWHELAYGNRAQVEAIARRSGSTWAKWNDRSDCVTKANGNRDGDRYQAINATNPETFEMRVFASSLIPEKVQAALQYVAASCEYTRGMTDAHAIHGGLSWGAFAAWVAGCEIYSALYSQMVKQGTVEVTVPLDLSLSDATIAAFIGELRGAPIVDRNRNCQCHLCTPLPVPLTF